MCFPLVVAKGYVKSCDSMRRVRCTSEAALRYLTFVIDTIPPPQREKTVFCRAGRILPVHRERERESGGGGDGYRNILRFLT